jgi:predicted dehydrogenase/succinate dehydrogenase flavin-adding protein (antitoxin of CptAB toxin-antitoxin module)
MASKSNDFRIGLIGAGGFSHFSVDAFLKVPGISISGVFDVSLKNAELFAQKFNCRIFSSQSALLSDEQTDIVYINTPPFLHYQNSKDCLLAGKHVICEKPAALHASEVKELIDIAKKQNLLYVVNLMQRYNPLFPIVQTLIDKKSLGEFLHGYFENYASDEMLDEDHWMWDEKKSGGIFIEHAVHFFDLIEGWLGKGELVSSQKLSRKGKNKKFWPEVQAICKYRNGLFNFYHGFHQANRMDRQELKLVFESGEVTLFEWVPSRLVLKALVSKKALKDIEELFPEGKLAIEKSFEGKEREYRSHSSDRLADYQIILETGDNELKYSIYQQLLTDMMKDQVEWLQNSDHKRRITEQNALQSVSMAEQANESAVLI